MEQANHGQIANLCQHARIEDGQIEEQFFITSQNGAYSYGKEKYKIHEQVDVARTIDLLMFSQSNKTNYIMAGVGSLKVKRPNPSRRGVFFFWDRRRGAVGEGGEFRGRAALKKKKNNE